MTSLPDEESSAVGTELGADVVEPPPPPPPPRCKGRQESHYLALV
ncbi:hypothetical protein OH492_16375 [Vibrio chagasii]|nr:hypothetical protein [Vibrio chagasii]